MSESQPTDHDLVEELCEIDEGLNDWELGFIDDIAQRVLQFGEGLSPKMREKAEQILREKAEQ